VPSPVNASFEKDALALHEELSHMQRQLLDRMQRYQELTAVYPHS
jgi:hypothetical protein